MERALELKMLYQPLTKAQEEKYRRFKAEKEKPAKIKDEAEVTEIGAMEMVKGGEIVHDDVTIPQITVNQEKFNTVNLQQEIAKGMQQIMEAKGKNEVADTMDTIKKIVEDIPYLKLEKEQEEYVQQPEETEHIATDEEIDGSLKLNFKELLGEDADGQMSMVMSEKTQLEHQITGQMSIQDVLEEWEKTRHAAEIALKEAEQQKLESAKARALQEAGDIMERLNDVIPKLDAGVTPKELLEEEYLKVPVDIIEQKAAVKEPEEEQKPDMQELYAEETVDEVQEPQEAPEEAIDEVQESQEAPEEAIDEVQESQEAPEDAADEAKEPVGEPEDIIMAEESEKDEILMQPTTMMPEITDDMLNVDDDTSDDEASQEKENVSEKRDFDHVTSFIEQEIAKMTAKNPGLEKKLDMAKTRKMPDISLPLEDGCEGYVIQGRCANFAFQGRDDVVSVFLTANDAFCVDTVADTHGVSVRKAKTVVRETNDNRKTYHKYYTGQEWGQAENYDLCLNVAKLGVDGVIAMIDSFIQNRK